MAFAVEWFSPSLGTPIVSLAEYGITFNRAAITALNNAYAVRIGFDRENKFIIVQSVERENAGPDIIVFGEKERKGFVRINNKDLVRFVLRCCPEIKLDKAVRFLGRVEGDLFVVDLNAPADIQDEVLYDQEKKESGL